MVTDRPEQTLMVVPDSPALPSWSASSRRT